MGFWAIVRHGLGFFCFHSGIILGGPIPGILRSFYLAPLGGGVERK